MGKILVTGGTGFIGSHACVSLINAGYSVVVVDNLCTSKVEALARIQLITGKQVRFYQADLRDEESIRQIFIDNKIDAVMHFAGLKAVGESVEKPLQYYEGKAEVPYDYFFFQCYCLRMSESGAIPGRNAGFRNESLWVYQGND